MISQSADCCVIVATKRFNEAKSRLASEFSPQQRMNLAIAMFEHVVLAVRHAETPLRLIVITEDDQASAITCSYGGVIVADAGRGVTEAFDCGVTYARSKGICRCILLPADLPLIRASSIDRILSAANQFGCTVICPDRAHQGTNAIVMSTDRPIDLSFGEGSFARHLGAACAKGSAIVIADAFLGCDLDSVDDVELMQA